jgi:2-polyprenyl-3-methyl-5-hydroxy-6-metoxy-1,4-benzoquinol methylase
VEQGKGSECLLCGNSDKIQVLFKSSRRILKCRVCGLVYAESNNASSNYTESYYRGNVYADYLKERDAIHKNADRTLARLERLVPGRTLLDVGCATGFFLEAARARGWTVRGLEVSEYASDYARRELGLTVYTGSIVSPPDGLSLFDVITLWDTIEHLDRPDQALSATYNLLHSHGVLVLTTGDYGSLLRRLTGRKWRLFADPTHNFFFDQHTLKKLLSQKGFHVLNVNHAGKWVSLLMILHQSGLPFAQRARDWLKARGTNPALYVNLWDVMTVIAKPVA